MIYFGKSGYFLTTSVAILLKIICNFIFVYSWFLCVSSGEQGLFLQQGLRRGLQLCGVAGGSSARSEAVSPAPTVASHVCSRYQGLSATCSFKALLLYSYNNSHS